MLWPVTLHTLGAGRCETEETVENSLSKSARRYGESSSSTIPGSDIVRGKVTENRYRSGR